MWFKKRRLVSEMNKKEIRAEFRSKVFKRDKYQCRCCGKSGYNRQAAPEPDKVPLDAHHICDRHLIENGGYVKENGISVCDECHLKAEEYWTTGIAQDGFSPDELYTLIDSSEEKAHEAAILSGGDYEDCPHCD